MKDSAFERFDKQVKEIYLLIDKMEANPDDFSKEDKMEVFSYLEELKTLIAQKEKQFKQDKFLG